MVDHFSLFVCLLFRFETRDIGKDEWPKKNKMASKTLCEIFAHR